MKIPKIIHHIWMGKNEIPDVNLYCANSIKKTIQTLNIYCGWMMI